ncbi:Protein of unknown function [Sphingomonas laterariae]|uniref:DUF4230 domain-containing protein n=1 Tax=Edaphosphingomonas laterariae TaxID=861865 RepID=A0A239ETE1_9SPHN|nr:DUF4230 domain-containing protein [Sphingomonas laterariae]SNS47142.1 Protein of unknown function [Sphingomonas laterariae]
MNPRTARWIAAILAVAMVAGTAGWFGARRIAGVFNPDPVTIATASLDSMREQNRLTVFAARYVAVVTSTQTRFGLSARKTLIMPGNVRYEVDLAKLSPRDVRWDAAARRLSVTLPVPILAGPEVDMAAIREYDGGGMLMALSDAETTLDTANRKAGQAELLRQARSELPMRLARDAGRRAVERNFAMPLKAAGLDAAVEVRFADEPRPGNGERMDASRSLEEIYGLHENQNARPTRGTQP